MVEKSKIQDKKVNSQKSSVQVKSTNKGEKPVIKAKGSGGYKKAVDNKFAIPEKVLKYLRIALLIAVLVVVFYPPFLRGLYFEDEQLPTEIFVFAVFIVFWVYKLLKRDKRFLETPIDYASLGFVIVYLLSIFVSVSTRLAIAEWLKYCMYFAVFFMLSELVDTYKSKIATLWVIVASGVGVSIIGIDGVAGEHIAKICNGIFKVLGLKIEFFETFLAGRIYSTLQYPNTLGAYLAAIFFISLGLVITSNKLWTKLIAAACGFIMLITFIFTLSRGAFIVMGASALILLIIMPNGNRVKAAIYALAVLIPTGVVSYKFYGYVENPVGNAKRIWLAILIGMVISALFAALAEYIAKWLEKISWKVYLGVIAAAIVVVTSAAIVALNASAPLELSHSAGQSDGQVMTQKNLILKPDKEYKLVFDVNANNSGNKLNAYSIQISNQTEKNILFGGQTQLASFEGKATSGTEQKEISFKVPVESRIVSINFINTYQGTGATFYKARIVDAASNSAVTSIVLKYKYLPQFLGTMFEGLQSNNSTVSRSIFYKDAFKIFKDHWFLGAGGGAWSLLYYSYQSYQYWSAQAHNYILQLGIESGIIGWLVLLLLVASILLMFVLEYRNRRENDKGDRILQAVLFTAIFAMIAHSVIDFDLSLSAVFLLLWELIAIFNSRYRSKTNIEVVEYNNTFLNKLLGKMDVLRKIKYVKFYPVIGLVTALIFIVFSILFVSARGYAAQAAKAQPTPKGKEIAMEYMKKAAASDMFNPVYKLNYANLLIQKANPTQNDLNIANEQASKAYKLAKYDYDYYIDAKREDILPRIIQYYFSVGDIENGLKAADRVTELRPLLSDKWQIKVNTYYEVMKFYLQNNDNNNTLKYAEKVLAVIDEARTVNKGNLNPFNFSDETYNMIGKVMLVKDYLVINKNIDFDKIVFNSIPNIDLNFDNKPDQWRVFDGLDYISITSGDRFMRVENTSTDKVGSIRSISFGISKGKVYHIEVEIENVPQAGIISFSLPEVSTRTEELKQNGKIYSADIPISSECRVTSSTLLLNVKGSFDIKSVKITEK